MGEQQDGPEGRQHADGPDWGALDVNAIHQSASWEFDYRWYPKQWLPAQQSQQHASHAAQNSPITVGDFKEEDADELWQHEGVGEVGSKHPHHQDAVVQEGERRAGQAHHNHRDPDHPLDLLL